MNRPRKLTTTPLLALRTAVTLIGGPPAAVGPDLTPAENQFISDLLVPKDWGGDERREPMAHTTLTPPALVEMGHQARTDIGSGVSPDVENDNHDMALFHQGIQAARAEVGTLVHRVGGLNLCPNVPNTTRI